MYCYFFAKESLSLTEEFLELRCDLCELVDLADLMEPTSSLTKISLPSSLFVCRLTGFILPLNFITNLSSSINSYLKVVWNKKLLIKIHIYGSLLLLNLISNVRYFWENSHLVRVVFRMKLYKLKIHVGLSILGDIKFFTIETEKKIH